MVIAAPGACALLMPRLRWLAVYVALVGLLIAGYFVWLGREIATGRNCDVSELAAIRFGVWLTLSLLVCAGVRVLVVARAAAPKEGPA